jgi:hypothetical protein
LPRLAIKPPAAQNPGFGQEIESMSTAGSLGICSAGVHRFPFQIDEVLVLVPAMQKELDAHETAVSVVPLTSATGADHPDRGGMPP